MKKFFILFHFLVLIHSQLASAAWIEDFKGDAQGKVAIFIGTFDPFHKGHQQRVNELLNSGEFTSVIVIPNDKPLHKPNATDVNIRLQSLTALYQNHPNIYIPKTANWKFPISTSILSFLNSKCPSCEFSGAFGEDLLESTMKSLGTRLALSHLKEWLIFRRGGQNELPQSFLGTKIREFGVVNNSASSDIRRKLNQALARQDSMPVQIDLPPAVSNDILFRGTYSYGQGYFKTGDVIAFSLRNGITPYLVQSYTGDVFDHVGVIVVEEGVPFIYEFQLGKGVIKAKLQDRWQAYADLKGETHFALAHSKYAVNEFEAADLASFLESQTRQKDPKVNSCTDLVMESMKLIRREFKFSPESVLHRQQMAQKAAGVSDRYSTQFLDSVSPGEILQSLQVNLTSEAQLRWKPGQMYKAWKESGDDSKAMAFIKKVFEGEKNKCSAALL